MSCVSMCGCANPIGTLRKMETKNIVGCNLSLYRFSEISTSTPQTFTAPADGYYLVIVVATGGDINTVFNRGYGVEHQLTYLNKGQQVSYSLGSDSVVKLPNGSLRATRVANKTTEPCVAFQYLGKLNVNGLIVDDFGGGYQIPSELDTYAGFHVTGLVPLASDINYMNTGYNAFMFWARARVNFPETGNYEFGAIGDDFCNLYLDGKYAVFYSSYPDRRVLDEVIETSGGRRIIQVTKGVHDVYLWNLSNKPSHIHSGMYIKDSSGNKIASTDEETGWKYVRSYTDCYNKYTPNQLSIIPNEPFPLDRTTGTGTDGSVFGV